MKLAMIGTGYVGLVSGVCFAEFGFHVTCVDKNPSIIERLKAGKVTIFEPGLDEIFERHLATGKLAEGIRAFAADAVKLEQLMKAV